MNKSALKDTRISVLVDQNYVHAYVLYYFGIRFFEYSELTLGQVCKKCGLKVEQVIREMEDPTHQREHPDRREDLYRIYFDEMKKQSVPCVEIKGKGDQRRHKAVEAIDKIVFKK